MDFANWAALKFDQQQVNAMAAADFAWAGGVSDIEQMQQPITGSMLFEGTQGGLQNAAQGKSVTFPGHYWGPNSLHVSVGPDSDAPPLGWLAGGIYSGLKCIGVSDSALANTSDFTLYGTTIGFSIVAGFAIFAGGEWVLGVGTFGGGGATASATAATAGLEQAIASRIALQEFCYAEMIKARMAQAIYVLEAQAATDIAEFESLMWLATVERTWAQIMLTFL